MRILITGGAGFVGTQLAQGILARGSLCGQAVTQIVLADQYPLPEVAVALRNDARVVQRTGPLLSQCEALERDAFDGVFHLASAVSGECELDFELGLRSNLDSTRALLDALRAAGNVPHLVFSSSIAVFGPDPGTVLPALVNDDTLPTPQTSYGTHKAMCELLIADYTRKGYIDGRAVRLNTVAVRPGKPNGAASSFFSGMIREPLAGVESICPVDASVTHAVASPARAVEGLIAAFEASREAFLGRTAMNLPALNVSVAEMLQALLEVAGPEVHARVKFQRDERIAGIVANWPAGVIAKRAPRLGLKADSSYADIIRQYIHDCRANGQAGTALKGLNGGNAQ